MFSLIILHIYQSQLINVANILHLSSAFACCFLCVRRLASTARYSQTI